MPGVFPDCPPPIVRNGVEGRELVIARWGTPSLAQAILDEIGKRAETLGSIYTVDWELVKALQSQLDLIRLPK
ncbi:hypothetical protein [Bradyrhizobium sp. LA6.10]|uniref:hypothetical protein n=1 Tax=Bradyrhizobium sp. LA6.10 TaxID=3156318 RepID=UPI0033920AE2